MTPRISLLALMTTVLPAPARADEPRHAVGAELALVTSAVRDDLLVPHAQSGGGLALGLEYLGYGGPGLVDVSVRAGVGVGVDRLGAKGLSIEDGLGLRYLLRLRPLGAWQVAVGPAAGADNDLQYFGDWDDAHGYWMGAAWLGPAARASRPIGARWRLDGVGELGLVGLIGRPPDYRKNKQDPLASPSFFFFDSYKHATPTWIGDWQLGRVRVELSRSPTGSFVTRAWRYGIEARLARADRPEPAFAMAVKLVLAKGWGW